MNRAVRPPPICRYPVGEGAKRVTTGAVCMGKAFIAAEFIGSVNHLATKAGLALVPDAGAV